MRKILFIFDFPCVTCSFELLAPCRNNVRSGGRHAASCAIVPAARQVPQSECFGISGTVAHQVD